MTNFLFWNINRKPIAGLIAALVEEHRIDVLMLAECEITPADILRHLNDQGTPVFHFAPGTDELIQCFTRFPTELFPRVAEGARYSIRELRLPRAIPITLAMVHLPSRLFVDEQSLDLEATATAQNIEIAERQVGHDRTVVVGDFNMDPFSGGVVAARGFNAVMHRNTALRGSRTLRDERYPFFYNPMWNHYGDEDGVAGTYYYDKSDHVAYYWHMFDQVLVRPALLDRFPARGVRIPTVAGPVSLLDSKGHPDRKTGSDHLPIVFSLDLEGESE